MSNRSRRKGHDFEREVARKLCRIFPEARRGWQYSRERAEWPCDVDGTPFRVECKVGKQPNLWSALDQVVRDRALADDPRPVAVIARRNRGKGRSRRDVVVMLFDEWLQLLEERYGAGGKP